MAEIVVVGGGLVGQCSAMLLAADGHSVTVLERDPEPPPRSADVAWNDWSRRGVNQFRMIHYFLPRFRDIVERDLPAVAAALDADGALRFNPLEAVPEQVSGGRRDGDQRHQSLTGRRPMVEAVVERVAATTPGITVHRGVAVRGVLTADARASTAPHVTGVVTDDGTEHRADLVVDAGGRRSAVPAWLDAVGARPVRERRDDCGFVYFARHFRSADGSMPPLFGPPLQAYESVSTLTLPADNGTWGVGLIASARDTPVRRCRDVDTWSEVVRLFPLVAHWIDAEPITDVAVMAGIEDRQRDFVVDGVPVATGLVPIGDASACTNPSIGRGCTIGLIHAEALRDLVREHDLADALGVALAWDDMTPRARRAVRAGDPPLRPSPSRRDRGAPRGSPVRDRRRGVAARRGVRRRVGTRPRRLPVVPRDDRALRLACRRARPAGSRRSGARARRRARRSLARPVPRGAHHVAHPLRSPPCAAVGVVGSGVRVVEVGAVVSGGAVVVEEGVSATSAGTDDVVVARVVLLGSGAGRLMEVGLGGGIVFVAATTPAGEAPFPSAAGTGEGVVVTTTVSRRERVVGPPVGDEAERDPGEHRVADDQSRQRQPRRSTGVCHRRRLRKELRLSDLPRSYRLRAPASTASATTRLSGPRASSRPCGRRAPRRGRRRRRSGSR